MLPSSAPVLSRGNCTILGVIPEPYGLAVTPIALSAKFISLASHSGRLKFWMNMKDTDSGANGCRSSKRTAGASLAGYTFMPGQSRIAHLFGPATTYSIESRSNSSGPKAPRETRLLTIVQNSPRGSREHENQGRSLAAHCGEEDNQGLLDRPPGIDPSNRSRRLPIRSA